jgi:hypothetical protein
VSSERIRLAAPWSCWKAMALRQERDSARLEAAIDAADPSAITSTLELQDNRSLTIFPCRFGKEKPPRRGPDPKGSHPTAPTVRLRPLASSFDRAPACVEIFYTETYEGFSASRPYPTLLRPPFVSEIFTLAVTDLPMKEALTLT